MEDFIIKEIEKIGKVIQGSLDKFGLSKGGKDSEEFSSIAKTELLNGLDLDVDSLLQSNDFVSILTSEHGFTPADLGKFAELLYDFVQIETDQVLRNLYIRRIKEIYHYLATTTRSLSFGSYDILKEMEYYE